MQLREPSDQQSPGEHPSQSAAAPGVDNLTSRQRWSVLTAAFLGWMFAGLEISLFVLISRPAMRDILGPSVSEATVGSWFAWYQCAFLLGAASGGWLFGWLGDRMGRTRSMGWSILCYSVVRGYPKMIRRYFWDFKPPGLGSRICDLRTARVVGA